MILPVSPDAPALVKAAASAILWTHIGGAAVGLVSGFAAMAFRKGGKLHRLAGHAFFVGMLAMAGVGAAVAPFLPAEQVPNTLAGVLTFYLVATAWATVRRRPGRVGRFETLAMLAAIGVAAGAVIFGWASATGGLVIEQPQGTVIWIFAAVAALAAACDADMLRRGGLAGPARLARHLWRMSLALFVAAGSFAGQPKAIPEFLRGSPLVALPMLLVLGLMVYWLIKVRGRRPVNRPAPLLEAS